MEPAHASDPEDAAPAPHVLLRGVLSLVLIAALLGGGAFAARTLAALRKPPAKAEVVRPPLLVRGMRVHRSDVTRTVVAYGTVRAPRTFRVTADVGGRVLDRHEELEPGDVIAAEGDELPVLLTLDARDAADRLARAQAEVASVAAEDARLATVAAGLDRRIALAADDLAAAERERDRVAGLVPRTLTPSDLDREQMQVQARAAALEALRAQRAENDRAREALEHRATANARTVDLEQRAVDRAVVRAPTAGRVVARHVEVGDVVSPGQVLVDLVDLSVVEVPLAVPASLAAGVRDGAQVRLSWIDGAEATGRVARRAPVVDAATRTQILYVELTGTPSDAPVAPGTHVRAELDGPLAEGVIPVPREAFLEGRLAVARPDGTFNDQPTWRITARPVAAEHRLEGASLVREGLTDGDVVVLTNLESLDTGSVVRIAFEGDASADAPQAPGSTPHAGAAPDR
ncbi:MAG: efflux RND transporter periplasmic adaptor subunit [Planctomycetota bacterium]